MGNTQALDYIMDNTQALDSGTVKGTRVIHLNEKGVICEFDKIHRMYYFHDDIKDKCFEIFSRIKGSDNEIVIHMNNVSIHVIKDETGVSILSGKVHQTTTGYSELMG